MKGMSCTSDAATGDEDTTWIFSDSYSGLRKMDIRNHSRSLLRFTYRSHFPALAPYSYTNDAGWGCMLRSAQMLIGQTMQRHYLGRDWRLPNTTEALRNDKDYCNIVRWCTDYPGPSCIYAIHHIIQCGMVYDKLPGEWYGPSTASLVLRDLTRLHRRKYGGPIEAHVTTGDSIYVTEVEKTFTAVRTQEVDPYCNEEEDEDGSRRRSRGSKKKHKRRSSDRSKKKSGKKSGGSHREQANRKVLPERSEDSVLSSIALHSRDMEDEANSFTKSVSSEYRSHSISSVSVTSEMGDESADDGQPDGLLTALSLEFNPFVLRSQSEDSQSKASSSIPITLTPGNITHSSSHTGGQEDTVFRSCSSGGSSYTGIDLKPFTKENIAAKASGLKTLISANMTMHDPLLNLPPTQKDDEWPSSLLLLLPLRLGLDKFNSAYIPALKKFLRHRNSVGILGGQVNRAIYFVGYRGDTLLGMDPHTVYNNPSLNMPFPSMDHLSEIHRSELHELSFSLLDPSLALAFYFYDRYEFKAFCDETKVHQDECLRTGELMLYNIQHAPASQQHIDFSGLCNSDSEEGSGDSDLDDEEYVFI